LKLSWEKEGKAFTFLKSFSDTGYVEDNHKVFVVTNIDGEPRVTKLDPSGSTEIPDGMRVRETYSPRMSKDLSIVYFGVYKWSVKEKKKKEEKEKKGDEKLPGVDIWHWKDDPIQPRQKVEYDRSDKDFSYLFAWDLEDNSIVRIIDDEIEDPSLTSNGNYVTVRSENGYKPQFRERYFDHYLVNPKNGDKELLMEKFTSLYGSSPDGRYMLYFKDKNWWLYDIEAREHKNISKNVPNKLWNTRYDGPSISIPPFGLGGWYENDSHLLLYDEYDIWKVNASTGEAEVITNGREDEIRFRTIRLDRENNYFREDDDLFVSATGDKSKMSGIYRITPNGRIIQLIYEDKLIGGLSKAKSRDKFIYRSEKYDDSPDLFVTNSLFRKKDQISNTNPQQDKYYWGRSELVDYTSTNGKALQGALYYPADYEEGKKYPMIVYIYEIRSTGLHRYTNPSTKSAYNTSNYTTDGYFVFQPDIVYETNHPGESAVDCVIPAVEEVIKTGMIDEEKIALMGHSWGAYQTAFIITQSDIFSAAIAGAPLINMISMYNEIYWNSGSPNQNIFETSQGRLREPWWVIMEEYMDNSPMYNAGNIETPLLVAFGNKDGAVDWHQGIEMFTTMRRMEKPYIMLVYEGENHGLRQEENMKDYSTKVNEFLRHHLLGEEAPAWISSGKTYLEKKEEEEKHNKK
jgi:dipeptidyl aminopeptidase/acylaminoacyl peptidase